MSAILAARDEQPAVRERALETIVASYWKPAYKYIRRQWSASNEEAKDLTQGFFASLLERGLLARFDPRRAAFRTYLRLCIDGFVANERRAAARLKRGAARVLQLDTAIAEAELSQQDTATGTAEDYFEQEWARSLLGQAVSALRERLTADGKALQFGLFERHDLCGHGAPPTYADLAREFAISVSDVTNRLASVRRQLRVLVLEKLRELTASDEEFHDEARRLLGEGAA